MRILTLVTVLAICFFAASCADISIPQGDSLLNQPLGDGSLRLGMSQEQVMSIYGNPNSTRTVISSEWNEPREEWVYNADVKGLPVNVGYLSDNLYLYFDGDSLTNISKKPLGTSAMAEEGYVK